MPKQRAEEFIASSDADFAYSVSGVGRFRVNAMRQRGSVGLVLRRNTSAGGRRATELLLGFGCGQSLPALRVVSRRLPDAGIERQHELAFDAPRVGPVGCI